MMGGRRKMGWRGTICTCHWLNYCHSHLRGRRRRRRRRRLQNGDSAVPFFSSSSILFAVRR